MKKQIVELGYSNLEMMAVAASRILENDDTVLVGTGLPLVSAILAKKTHAKEMTILMEAVAFDCDPDALPFCVADPRAVYKTVWRPTAMEVMGQFLQRGKVDVGFLGGAQVDRYGNLNSTCIGDYNRPKRRMEGSGGANDIASLAGKTVITIAHERKRFVEEVDYITSPGWRCRTPDGTGLVHRRELGLNGGPYAVVSTMGVLKFDRTSGEIYLHSYYEDLGITREQVCEATGFALDTSKASPVGPPFKEELEALRTVVDPEGIFMKY